MTHKEITDELRSIQADNFMNAAGPPRDGPDALAVAAMVVSLTAERDRLRELLTKAIPAVAARLRHLRSLNDPRALQLTNDLADMNEALLEAEGE